MSRAAVTYLLVAFLAPLPGSCAELTPATRQAFDRYVALFESKWQRTMASGRVLSVDGDQGKRSRVHAGELEIVARRTLDNGVEIKPPGGMIQDWLGTMFLPRTSLAQARSIMQDYANYQSYFKPEVVESKLISHHGDAYEVFLRLYKRQVVTAVLNTTYEIHYATPAPGVMDVVSHSTRIAEVTDPAQSMTREEPPGKDNGYLWALHSYWRFEEADGGVYAECEAISLSRDVPFGLGWAIKGFLDKFPKDSMQNTLAGVKRALARGAADIQPASPVL